MSQDCNNGNNGNNDNYANNGNHCNHGNNNNNDNGNNDIVVYMIKTIIRNKIISSRKTSYINMDDCVDQIYSMLYESIRDDENIHMKEFIEDFSDNWLKLLEFRQYICGECDFIMDIPKYFPIENIIKFMNKLYPNMDSQIELNMMDIIDNTKIINISLK